MFPFLSDNGPHYHNSGVLFYLMEVNKVFNITLKESNNFEASAGKSQLDSLFAHVSHKLSVAWVRMGNDLESGEQVADLIKVYMKCSYTVIPEYCLHTVRTEPGTFSFNII